MKNELAAQAHPLLALVPEDGVPVPLWQAHAKVDALTEAMVGAGAEVAVQGELSCTDYHHDFCPGVYRRWLRMRAGTYGVSAIHGERHFWALMRGVVDVWDTDTQQVQRVVAPYQGITEVGTRRVLVAVTDAEWVTFHRTLEGEDTVAQVLERILIPPEVMRERLLKDVKTGEQV
jgi:hypothetical protein